MGFAVEGADCLFPRGVENHDIGVAADRDRALFWKQAEDLRRRRGGQLDKTIERDVSLTDAVVIDQAHAALDARAAVGNLAEVVLAELLLLLEAERTMDGRDDVECARA